MKKKLKWTLVSVFGLLGLATVVTPILTSCSSTTQSDSKKTHTLTDTHQPSTVTPETHTGDNSPKTHPSEKQIPVVTNGHLLSGLQLTDGIAELPSELPHTTTFYNLDHDNPVSINPQTHTTTWTTAEALNYWTQQVKKYTLNDYKQDLEANIHYQYQLENQYGITSQWTHWNIDTDPHQLSQDYFRQFVVSNISNVQETQGKLSYDWDTSLVFQIADANKKVIAQQVLNNHYHIYDLVFTPSLLVSNNEVHPFLTPNAFKATNELTYSNLINEQLLVENSNHINNSYKIKLMPSFLQNKTNDSFLNLEKTFPKTHVIQSDQNITYSTALTQQIQVTKPGSDKKTELQLPNNVWGQLTVANHNLHAVPLHVYGASVQNWGNRNDQSNITSFLTNNFSILYGADIALNSAGSTLLDANALAGIPIQPTGKNSYNFGNITQLTSLMTPQK